MDNRPEEDAPMYIPARCSYEVVQYPASRRRPSFVVLFFVILSALLAFWLVTHWISAYDRSQEIRSIEKRLPGLFPNLPVDRVKVVSLIAPSVPPPLVGPYHLPLSTQYRLAGKIQRQYMATSGPGAYVLIPAKDCQLVNGGPYCEYHGATVTQSSGSR
ncbi:MAG: hypothetical protein ACYDCW_13920 [Acidithiobacillus ferrivorans]